MTTKYSLGMILLVVNLLAIGLTLTMTEWLGDDDIDAISRADVELFLIVLISIAILCMIVAACSTCCSDRCSKYCITL